MSTTEQQHQQTVRRLQEATQRLSSAQNEQERTQWSQQVKTIARELTGSGRSQKTAVILDAVVPSPDVFHRISRDLQDSQTPGLKEVAFRQEGGETRIRIQVTPDAYPRIQDVLNRVGQQMQMAYSGSQYQQGSGSQPSQF